MRRLLGGFARALAPRLTRSYHMARLLGRRDGAGPVPWYTYPAQEYLAQLDTTNWSVFEFGAGHSSLYWAARARKVRAVESDRAWHDQLAARRAPNLELALREDKAAYVGSLSERDEAYDLIVVDGRWRRSCAAAAPGRLSEGGMIILDNSDWHPGTARDLREAGFLQVDFSGFGPINAYAWTTSLFLRAPSRLQAGRRDAAPVGGLAAQDNEDE